MSNKQDSNLTGLRIAQEATLKVLPSVGPAVTAKGTISVSANPTAGQTLTVGSDVYTFIAAGPADPDEIVIGATPALTAAAIENALNAATDVQPVALAGVTLTIEAQTAGVAGNQIALATNSPGLVLSGVTLANGAEATTDPVWRQLEPNSYSDFGSQTTTTARNPINASRQRKKGVVTDLDASGGFQQDVTLENTPELAQGFFFADARHKPTTAPYNGLPQVPIVSVTGAGYTAASGLSQFALAGMLVLASGFGTQTNNGLKVRTGGSDTAVNAAGLSAEANPPAGAKLVNVGFQFPAGDVSIAMVGGLPRLVSTAANLDQLGLIPGEWVFLGGDELNTRFADSYGYARINVVTPGYIEFDKTDWVPAVQAGAGLTIRMFFGTVIKNESNPALIKRRTYQIERTLGNDDDGPQAEYLLGSVANEMTWNFAQADKITADWSFVSLDNEQRPGTLGLKAGLRPNLPESAAFNTTNDFSRIKLASVSSVDAAPEPLFGYATEMTLSVNNNVTPNKALGVMGGFDTSAGDFEVGGSITAYFSTVRAVQAVRENADVTLDLVLAKGNRGLVLDIPLLSLGDGRLNVEKDAPIMVPLENLAAESKFGHTLMLGVFEYVPDLGQ